MVSGLVTSPCDQLRMRSGDARLMRMLSKSVMLLPRSNGLERYKVSSVSFRHSRSGMTRKTALWHSKNVPNINTGGKTPNHKQTAEAGLSQACPQLIGCSCQCRTVFGLDQLHIQAQRLQFANQHVERLRNAGLDRGFTLDDGLVNLGATIHVVGLRREQLLQDVGGAISLERPHFHFSE